MRGETWITTKQAMQLLQKSERWLAKMREENIIRHTRVGGMIYYSLDSIEMMFDDFANKAHYDPTKHIEKRLAEAERLCTIGKSKPIQETNLELFMQKRAITALAKLASMLNQLQPLLPSELNAFTKRIKRDHIRQATEGRLVFADAKAINKIREQEKEVDDCNLPVTIATDSDRLLFEVYYQRTYL